MKSLRFQKIAGIYSSNTVVFNTTFHSVDVPRDTEEFYKFDRIDYDSIYELEFSEENSDRFLEAEGMIFLLSLEILKDFRNMKRS